MAIIKSPELTILARCAVMVGGVRVSPRQGSLNAAVGLVPRRSCVFVPLLTPLAGPRMESRVRPSG